MTRGRRFIALVACAAVCVFLATAFAPSTGPSGFEDGLTASTAAESYTATIEVNVTDDVGRPVADAVVTLEGNDTYTNVDADEYGRLTIPGLLADTNGTEYSLSARCDGYLELAAVSVTVTPSNTTWVNLTVMGGTIWGIVTKDFVPVAGANITLDESDLNTTTDADGFFRIDGLKGGKYFVTATASNHEPLTLPATLLVADYVWLNFQLSSMMGSLSGTVLHATSLEPLENASVSVKVEGTTPVTYTVATEADGSFYVPNLPAGIYSVTVSLMGFNTSTVDDIEVVSGMATEDVDVLLVERPTALSGYVRSGTILLVGANVSVVGTEFFCLTSVEGRYEIEGIPAGVYTIEASLQGYLNSSSIGIRVERGDVLQLNFNLTGLPGGLRGTVYDTATGEELAGVRILLLPLRETITNVNGEFEFTGLKEGNYTIQVILEGYRPVEISPIIITHEETTDLGDIHLEQTKESFGGFIFGFDLAHSMMILALFLTIVILALAVVLRIRTFEAPDKAPAIYDELYDEEEAEETGIEKPDEADSAPESESNGADAEK